MNNLANTRLASPTPSSASSGRIDGLTARDAERVAAAIVAELAASTRNVYASAWRQWEAWCIARGVTSMPALTVHRMRRCRRCPPPC
jgi:hypothetical protein